MHFHSNPEALSFALLKLYEFDNKYKETKEIIYCIENLKIAFENHEQDVDVICQHLDSVKSILNKNDLTVLIKLQQDIKKTKHEQTPTQKFANPLGRRSESELFILLLHSPTKEMMNSVNRVSIEILKTLEQLEKNHPNLIFSFLNNLEESSHVISCGGFKKQPTLAEVVAILKNNDPKTLVEIMFIHFKFGQCISRNAPITTAPTRTPVGKLSEVIQEVWQGKIEDFFKDAISQNSAESTRYRSYIADEKIYASSLYTTELSRGRLGHMRKRYTNQFGLMLPSQQIYSKDFPHHSSRWVPDCIGQNPDFDSQYVKDCIDNDTVYVSGPSGMASVLLGQMEFMANFEDIRLKQHYLTAICSYIVGAGFHSLHEVIGPAEFCLNLAPGYHITPPRKGTKAAPPNYHAYYAQQMKIDPEFQECRDTAWKNYLTFFQHTYCQKKPPIKTTPIDKKVKEKEKNDPLCDAILNELDQYIHSRGTIKNNKINLNISTRLFRNSSLTQEKIKNAILIKKLVNEVFATTNPEDRFSKILILISDFINTDESLEKQFNKSHSCCTKSGFALCLGKIEKLIIQNPGICYPFPY